MYMIQYLSVSKKSQSIENVEFSAISSPKSLDSYEVNIIDFNSYDLWKYNNSGLTSINAIKDLGNLNIMMARSLKTKFVFLFPQNFNISYNSDYKSFYRSKIEIKNATGFVLKILNACFPTEGINMIYEINECIIDNNKINSDFFFELSNSFKAKEILKSTSDKLTTMKRGNCIYSTLNFKNDFDSLLSLLTKTHFIKKKLDFPIWFNTLTYLNDDELKHEKQKLLEELTKIQTNISNIDLKLIENNKFKSILYANGYELHEKVVEILQKIVDIDLSGFKEVYNEDFHFIIDDIHYIGEIKGVNDNLKNQHLAQLDNHVQEYIDKTSVDEKNVKGILIINPLRKTNPDDRDPINHIQIKKAKEKYNFLIITTEDLLRLYEKFIDNSFKEADIINVLRTQTGLITLE